MSEPLPEIDRPDVVADVRATFDRYEQALLDNDVDVLVELFWDDGRTVRYGIDEIHHGHAAIAEYRRGQPAATLPRTLRNTVVTAFGADVATVDTEFLPDGSAAVTSPSSHRPRTTSHAS